VNLKQRPLTFLFQDEKRIRQKNVDSEPRLELYGTFPQETYVYLMHCHFHRSYDCLTNAFPDFCTSYRTFFISDVDVTRPERGCPATRPRPPLALK